MNKILLIAILIGLCSCSQKGKVKEQIAQLMSNKINLPEQAQITFLGKDTSINDFFESELKLVVYSDSTRCVPCETTKLFLWDSFIEYSKEFDGRLKFYYIYSPAPNGIKEIRNAMRIQKMDYPILIDKNYDFERLNPHLPKNSALHTFLLDQNNNVVWVGSPLQSAEFKALFYEQVEKRLL